MSKSIGENAMDIMQSIARESSSPQSATPSQPSEKNVYVPDIRGVEINESFMNTIMERSFGVKVPPQTNKPITKQTNKPTNIKSNRNLEDIVNEFYQVVSKAKTLIQEMTTCGMIGVGKVKPLFKKKKVKGK